MVFHIFIGARSDIKKIIFLITDGSQNPLSGPEGAYDPVKSSRPLYDDGAEIFVVVIGDDVDKKNMEEIARDPSKVYYAKTVADVASLDFVKNVSRELCNIKTTSKN